MTARMTASRCAVTWRPWARNTSGKSVCTRVSVAKFGLISSFDLVQILSFIGKGEEGG